MNPGNVHSPAPGRQRGASLVVGLILLATILVIVVNAFGLSHSNAKSVANMQVRNEGIMAANQAIELVIGSAFTDAPVTQSINVDIDKNGSTDYVVAVATPTCVRALQASSAAPSDVELPAVLTSGATWNTEWEIEANVTDTASGASARVKQGIRVLLSDAQKSAVCP